MQTARVRAASYSTVQYTESCNIAVFPILAHPDKNNLQSAQLLIGKRSYPAGWLAVVHLFYTVVLVGIGKKWGDCNIYKAKHPQVLSTKAVL